MVDAKHGLPNTQCISRESPKSGAEDTLDRFDRVNQRKYVSRIGLTMQTLRKFI